tara:strand:+ start:606 stop:1037 length:432 start_codon:yes stop_codon:yes gene_type:complete
MITEEGDVYSTKYGKIKKMKLRLDYKGYKTVILSNNGKRKFCKVHRLVAQTYIPNPDNLSQVNHIDEDKSNNNVDNLEWCTNQYNIEYSHAKSYIVENVSTGERQTVFNLRAFCRDTGLSRDLLRYTLIGKTTHKGYKVISMY